MPNYPWLAKRTVDGEDIQARMRVLKLLGDPYSDEEIAGAPVIVEDKTELDALVAYLQGLGVHNVPSKAVSNVVSNVAPNVASKEPTQ